MLLFSREAYLSPIIYVFIFLTICKTCNLILKINRYTLVEPRLSSIITYHTSCQKIKYNVTNSPSFKHIILLRLSKTTNFYTLTHLIRRNSLIRLVHLELLCLSPNHAKVLLLECSIVL